MVPLGESLKNVNILGKKLLLYLHEELWLKGIGSEEARICPEKDLSLVELVNKAHQEWEQAKALFNEVAEPELVDHAIYAMEAAERKYIYLLRQAKKENIIDESIYRIQQNGLA